MLAVDGTEPVVDVDVAERGELVGEGARSVVVLARLARVEADVLEQHDVAVGRAPTTAARADSPTMSVAKATGRPSSSPSRAATGASENFGSGAPFGRPRWAHTMTRAPASASAVIVGTRARMRPSSVIAADRVERDVEVRPDEDPRAGSRRGEEVVE